MTVLGLAIRSLRNRMLTTSLTVGSIALSVALLVGVESVRTGVRQSFIDTIRGTDLIVGAKGGTIQLLLSSVFGIGAPAGGIPYTEYQSWAAHPAVKWTIPYSLGDSHRGYRVIGTTHDFYEHYRYRRDGRVVLAEGREAETAHEAVLGADVAGSLGYGLGRKIVLTHGLAGTGISDHDNAPFEVVGVLARTFTPIDRAVYVTLEGIGEMHEGFGAEGAEGRKTQVGQESGGQDGRVGRVGHGGVSAMPGANAPVLPGSPASPGFIQPVLSVPPASPDGVSPLITSFFLGTTNRFETLQLQREINTSRREPLTAIIPALALAEMWRGVGYAEGGLFVVSGFVLMVGLLGMLVSLYTSLNERRREMAILRAIGAGPRTIVALLVLESGILSALGAVLGLGLAYLTLWFGSGVVERSFGFHLALRPPGVLEWMFVSGVIVAGLLIGLVPAWKAYRNTLADGLSVRL